ncbi:MAG: hypothetical protein LBR08_04185 [Bacteroidales bacterium]|jgi:hypothetical protein|nr:hypothetical protein [Bacteroidales bacterium]
MPYTEEDAKFVSAYIQAQKANRTEEEKREAEALNARFAAGLKKSSVQEPLRQTSSKRKKERV